MKSAVCALLAFVAVGAVCYAEWVCEKGVPYKENECNECSCTENNLLQCGDKGCLDPLESILFNCKVGTITQNDCNSCECVKDLGTVCTNKQC